MAGPPSASRLRSSVGSITVVRLAPPLRQRRWIHRAHALLLFSRSDLRDRALVCRTRNRRSLGSIRHVLHRHRGCPHTLCSARSRTLELASYVASWSLTRAGYRHPILSRRDGAAGAGVYAVSRAVTPRCRRHHLERSLPDRPRSPLRRLPLSSRLPLGRPPSCLLARHHLAGVHNV